LRKFEECKPREAWRPRVDENGEVLHGVQLVPIGEGEAEVIKVAVPGDPGVRPSEMVGGRDDRAGLGDGRPQGDVVPRDRDPLRQRKGGGGGGVMVTASIQLAPDTRLSSEPLRVEPGRVLGHMRVLTDSGEACIYGTPEWMHALAAEASRAAEEAEHLLRIEQLLLDAGRLEPTEG
jgi:hypothetical protein